MSYRDELLSDYSDTHKDAAGFRPRGDVSHLTDAELEAEIASLNRYGWVQALEDAHSAVHTGTMDYDAVNRMAIGEMIHRIEELEALARRPRTAGEGWALIRE